VAGLLHMRPVEIAGRTVIGIEVELPKTHLVILTTGRGYLMCGALDVGLLSTKLAAREIVAARAVGVRTLEELMAAPVESATPAAQALGVEVGQDGRTALLHMV